MVVESEGCLREVLVCEVLEVCELWRAAARSGLVGISGTQVLFWRYVGLSGLASMIAYKSGGGQRANRKLHLAKYVAQGG